MDILPQLALNSIIAGSIYALVAMGFNLAYGATRFFNLAHGSMAAIGGYTMLALFEAFRCSASDGCDSPGLLVGIVFLAIVASGLSGYALEKLVYMPLRKRKASGMVLLVASLGVFSVVQALLAMIFTSRFQALSRLAGATRSFTVGSGVITDAQLASCIAAVSLLCALRIVLKTTLFGKKVRAVSDDEEVAKIVGINTARITGAVFFIAAAAAGLAGILVGLDTGIEPTMGLWLLLKGVIAAIVGGTGSVPGAFVGAYLLGFAENFGIWKIAGEWKDAIAFALLMTFLLFRPRGLVQR